MKLKGQLTSFKQGLSLLVNLSWVFKKYKSKRRIKDLMKLGINDSLETAPRCEGKGQTK